MKIFNKAIDFFLLIFFIILQVVFGEQLKLNYLNFDFILVVIVALTFKNGLIAGMLYGFFAGLVFDILSSNIIGISPLILALSAFIIGRLLESGLKIKLVSYILVVFILTEINIIIISIIYYLFSYNIDFVSLGMDLLLKPMFNILIIFIVFPLMRVKFSGEELIEYQYK
ncbi:MAG: rod shape-determining protein MreD [Actinobacteria bacterium]|nr:rod shape-determining protein MreD [Actinomycetota bacterium]